MARTAPVRDLALVESACDCVVHPSPRPRAALPASVVQRLAPPGGRPILPQRRRVWELGDSLHCSIIGTCLTTDELKRLLRKLGVSDASDHTLHGTAVGLAGRQGVGSKLLNKALDDRHRGVIKRFEAATDRTALLALWRASVEAGDIPGAYWAALSHPAADQPLIAEVFGEVHMLSHLVGTANRADIRRLAAQETEIAGLRDTVARQQDRLRADITERDARIRALQDLVGHQADPAPSRQDDGAELHRLIAELRGQLSREARRREASEARAAAAEEALRAERAARLRAEADAAALRREIAAIEAALDAPAEAAAPLPALPITVLYVGGRSGQTATLREAATRRGAELLHHDAEHGSALLPGLVGRADLVVFPVDCVSHDAALNVKRLCRQAGRPFQALRSAGTASFLAALATPVAMAAE
ncbi:MAG TPA: DUF2325 domain-containing protein [Roseomonas sp.]